MKVPATGFRIRLRVRIANALTTEAQKLSVTMLGREVTITSQDRKKSLKGEKWIVLGARGFVDENEAWIFGRCLKQTVQLACLSSRLGVDVGEDRPSGWVSESFARSEGLIKASERLAPNVHGLAVLPDDDLTRIPIMDATATVTSNPDHLTSALQELGNRDVFEFGTAASGIRLLNLALMTSEPLAQMVLAVSSIEELGQNQKWSPTQKAMISELVRIAESTGPEPCTEAERAEVVTAMSKGLFRLSLREGVKRILSFAGLDHLIGEWDRLYGIRSVVFHGTVRLSGPELHTAARETITLCTQIVFATVLKEGGNIPSIARSHFGDTNEKSTA